MRIGYKILRAFIVTLIVVPPVFAVAIYILLSLPWAQNAMRDIAEKELSAVLGTDLYIGDVSFFPFDGLSISDVSVNDDFGEQALSVKQISAGIDLSRLISGGKIVIDYAAIKGLKAKIYKSSDSTEINIAGIIRRLQSTDKSKSSGKFDLKINTFVIDDADLSYDILDSPSSADCRFDPRHIRIQSLDAAANLPSISNDSIIVQLYTLNFKERSGFILSNIKTTLTITPDKIHILDTSIKFPNSTLNIGNSSFSQKTLNDIIVRHDNSLLDSIFIPVEIKDGSHLTPADFKAFIPSLASADFPFYINICADVQKDTASVTKFTIYEPHNNLLVDLEGKMAHVFTPEKSDLSFPSIHMTADGSHLASYLSENFPQTKKLSQYLTALGQIDFHGTIKANPAGKSHFEGKLITDAGSLRMNAAYSAKNGHYRTISGRFSTNNFDLSAILPHSKIGNVQGSGNASIKMLGNTPYGKAKVSISRLEYNEYVYSDITAELSREGDIVTADAKINDQNIVFKSEAKLNLDPDVTEIDLTASISDFRPDILGLDNHYPGHTLSAELKANTLGRTIEASDGEISIKNISYVDNNGEGLKIQNIAIKLYSSESPRHIDIKGDFINGSITGLYEFASLPTNARYIISQYLPALINEPQNVGNDDDTTHNIFDIDINISPCSELCEFLRLPVSVISPVSVSGNFNSFSNTLNLYVDIPFLQQGKQKIFYDTALGLNMNIGRNLDLYATTSFDTKKGPMVIIIDTKGQKNRLDTNIDWKIIRDIPIEGTIDFSTTFHRGYDIDMAAFSLPDKTTDYPLIANIHFNPGKIIFGETVWDIIPSDIIAKTNDITISGFSLMAENEHMNINGRVSHNPDDVLSVSLQSMQLYDIFETLQINKALIGGKATGSINASSLLSPDPVIYAPYLKVDSISYNRCVLGDANVVADFDIDRKAFSLNADIHQYNGCKSRIYGEIFAGKSYLDLHFDTKKVNIGFLRPFMSAFAQSIEGQASGYAHLFGSFKDVDLEGDLHVDSLNLGIDFTNTIYTVKNEDLHIKPGQIDFDNVVIYDAFGHTGILNGNLSHHYFHDAAFNFEISKTDRLLVYDTNKKINPRWHGRIFGNGSIGIKGRPGIVDIDVNISTAPQTEFTFALLDMMDAPEYSFITFTDRTPDVIIDSIIEVDDTPYIVKRLRDNKYNSDNNGKPSAYNLKFEIAVTRDASLNLIMDPVADDRIQAKGNGIIKLTYDSADEDFGITGKYVIDQGKYHFTLQDIIVRDFNILKGGSITFRGDPYAAQLDMSASYSTHANLTDLDPSFALDKDINRRNVMVNAILRLTGDIRQPEIEYDFAFPNSSEDVYRRVMSIIGSTDMKYRQIMYLLALQRFYTPEYMASTRSNNELISVASSTVSSQISNMLGALSENWSVAPNLRSEKGDFSDIEVDVALSSRLLNNRLIFNGNFGYRDQSMNTNQFVGDFDIEYLLNPRGTWRLKAYNRYNDQNYYIRSATTTQGIGIMYTRDFDNMFGFLRRKKRQQQPIVIDSISSGSDDENSGSVPDQP